MNWKTMLIDVARGFVRDVCDDAVSVLEVVLDLRPEEFSFLDGPVEYGMQKLLDIMELVDG